MSSARPVIPGTVVAMRSMRGGCLAAMVEIENGWWIVGVEVQVAEE